MLSRLRRMVQTALRSDGLLPVDAVRHQTIAAAVAADPEGWAAAVKRAKGGRKVLIATTVTGFAHVNTVESVLAAALTLRGAEVHLLVCDAVLPGCLRAEQDNVPDWRLLGEYKLPDVICASCMANGRKTFGSLGLSIHRLSELLTDGERTEARRVAAATPLDGVRSVTLEHTAVGEHAHAGCLRYFARGSIEGIEGAKIVSQRYLEASILTVRAVSRLFDRIGNVSTAVFHHGIYVPQGLTGEVCRQRGIPVVNWNPSYRKNTFIFSHGDTYHHTLIDEPTAMWESVRWSEAEERKILDYLASRVTGTRDWIWFHEKPDQDFQGFAKKVGLNLQKPMIGMLTNVMWDAQLHYPANAFAGMLEWTIETIRYFEKRPDLQLLLRVHPAEIRGTAPSRQPIIAEIAKVFPTVPANVYVIRPESPVSTYAAMAHCDSVLIYGTKTGVELTAIGTPVIVGGEAWIRHKGLTRDARSPEEYFRFLDSLPLGQRMPEEQVVRARKYAYHFFFRRMIPLPFIEPLSGKIYDLNISSLESLDRTHYPGLDVICDGILEGSPFIYNAEIYGLHDEVSG